jgi:hypothetical protein
MQDLGHWLLDEELTQLTELPFGFIYIITNNISNRKYIGKKQCITTKKRPPLKGKKNKRHEKVETDWKSYTSSSNDVNKDIESIGMHNFTFKIVKYCNSKWELSYHEAKIQFEREVLLTNEYYNGIINLRIGNKPASAS